MSEVALIRAFSALAEMWVRRYDTETSDIPDPHEGEPFGAPVVVDVGRLAEAHTALLDIIRAQKPKLWEELNRGGVPDAPLPDAEPGELISLDEHRVRSEGEFQDEQVAYMEALWGKKTFGFNLAVRDLEAMRRGVDDKTLRPPQTYYEMRHMILHIRSIANDIAREYGMQELVKPEDDLKKAEEAPQENP